MGEHECMDPLITVADLADRLGIVTVLDVRYRMGGPPGAEEFGRGHVPTATYVDLDATLAAPAGLLGRHPLPEVEGFAAAMRAAGVSVDVPVVVYDDWSGRAAARAWWLLRHHGHDDVRVLDGGWSAWSESGARIETGPPAAAKRPGDFAPTAGRLPVVATADLPDPGLVLIDARAPERYRGDVEPIDPVAGHIPGAVNLPTDANLDESGRFRSAAELADLYATVGVRPGTRVAAYCGSGVTACHDLLALARIGVDAALYPESWSGWVVDRDRPVGRTTPASRRRT